MHSAGKVVIHHLSRRNYLVWNVYCNDGDVEILQNLTESDGISAHTHYFLRTESGQFSYYSSDLSSLLLREPRLILCAFKRSLLVGCV